MTLKEAHGDRAQFLVTFNPDYQKKICHNKRECHLGNYPTLARMKNEYGDNMPFAWLLPQLYDLSEYCGCKEKLKGRPLEQCADVIAAEYYFLKISELMLFFHYFKSGRYGRFYGSVDPIVITSSLLDFIRERNHLITLYEQEQRELREAEERKANPPISWEEYCRMKGINKPNPLT